MFPPRAVNCRPMPYMKVWVSCARGLLSPNKWPRLWSGHPAVHHCRKKTDGKLVGWNFIYLENINEAIVSQLTGNQPEFVVTLNKDLFNCRLILINLGIISCSGRGYSTLLIEIGFSIRRIHMASYLLGTFVPLRYVILPSANRRQMWQTDKQTEPCNFSLHGDDR